MLGRAAAVVLMPPAHTDLFTVGPAVELDDESRSHHHFEEEEAGAAAKDKDSMKRSLRAVLGLLCGAFLHSAAASEQLPGGTALNLKDQHHALLSKRASLTNEVSVTCCQSGRA